MKIKHITNRKHIFKLSISILIILVFVMPGSAILNKTYVENDSENYISIINAQELVKNQQALILDIQEEYKCLTYQIEGVIAVTLSELGCRSCFEDKLNNYDSIILYSIDESIKKKASNLLIERGHTVYELADDITNIEVGRSSLFGSGEEIVDMIHLSLEESPVFLLFYAEWCVYSQQEIRVLDSLKDNEEYEDIKFIYIDAEKYPELANDFEITSFPTMFLIDDIDKNGYEFKEQFYGFVNENELCFAFDKILGINSELDALDSESTSSSCTSIQLNIESHPVPISGGDINPSMGDGLVILGPVLDKVISTSQVQPNPPNPGCCVNEPNPNIRMTDQECCDAIRSQCSNGDWGGVICCQERMISCVWHFPPFYPPSDPNGTDGRDYGHQLAEECVKVHEDDHHDSVTCDHTPSGQICRPPFLPGIDPPAEECHAHTAEIICLNEKYQSCISQFPAGSADRAACIAYVTQIRAWACSEATQHCGYTPPECNIQPPT